MTVAKMEDKILYNIKLVILTELDPLTGMPKTGVTPIRVSTAEELKLKPVVSKGDEKVLRSDDVVLATAKTKDLVYGYDVEFKDNRFSIGIVQLIEGGTLVMDATETTKVIGYKSPMMSQGNLSKPFKTEIYVEEREGDDIIGYTVVTLNKCTGQAPEIEFKKGEFYSPNFTIDARENTKANKPIKEFGFVDALPSAS